MAEAFIGQISMFGFNWAPRNWALCNGQIIAIEDNTALFSLIGTIYGGDGKTNFALPNLQSRVPIHHGQGAGLTTRNIGQLGGQESVTLNTNQMPSHTHTATITNDSKLIGVSDTGTTNDPNNAALAKVPDVNTKIYHPGGRTKVDMEAGSVEVTSTANVESAGGGHAHSIMNPFQVISFCICLYGIYPSRN